VRRSIVRRAGRALGEARAEALGDLLADARNLLLGRPRPAPEDPLHVLQRRARQSIASGSYDAALAEADRLTQAAIQLRRDAARRRGNVAAVARAMGEAQRTTGGAQLTSEERAWLGRAVASDPRWTPWIPKSSRTIEPRDNVVLHVLGASLPHVTDEDALRSQATMLGEREEGLEPIVVTALGFPRSIGVALFESLELVEGIAHHRLDAGAGYDPDTPADEYLSDFAWFAARLVEQLRPRWVHATVNAADPGLARVAIALRARLGTPLVLEVAPAADPAPLAADQAVDLREADAVVATDERTRDMIVAAGVPAANVHLIAVSVSGGPAPGGQYRELYESLGDSPVAPSTGRTASDSRASVSSARRA
jgi:hypothetical protein